LLAKLKALGEQVRIGGKGTARRKKKVVHKNAAADDKRLQTSLKKLNLSSIPTIEEVISRCPSNCTGQHVQSTSLCPGQYLCQYFQIFVAHALALSELFPSVMNQLETAKMRLSKMNGKTGADAKENDAVQNDDDDDVPDLVGDFDEKSRLE
uniref:Nascent polypeptide-associated complex subunit beta n=1 Tax=Schistocephalus solidus TaxID=70667 RepID=A0A183THU2_SCHSO